MGITIRKGRKYRNKDGKVLTVQEPWSERGKGIDRYSDSSWVMSDGCIYMADGRFGYGNAPDLDIVAEVIEVKAHHRYRTQGGVVVTITGLEPTIHHGLKWSSVDADGGSHGWYNNDGTYGLFEDEPDFEHHLVEEIGPVVPAYTEDHSGIRTDDERPSPWKAPSDRATRKATPIYSGFVRYFPDAMAAVAQLSFSANSVHNPGEPLHWSKDKSNDHPDCVARHLAELGEYDVEPDHDYRYLHDVKLAWRALANLQIVLESGKAPRIAKDAPVE